MTRPKPACARCGHPHAAHQHYDGGTWCGPCGRRGCKAYQRPRWWRPAKHAPGVDELDQALALAATAHTLHPADRADRCSLCHGWLPVWDTGRRRWVLVKEKCPAHETSEEARP